MTITAEDISQQLAGTSPYALKLGIACEEIQPDSAVFRLPFDPGNSNPYGFIHGGALASLADCAVTAAAWSRVDDIERYCGLTVDLALAFVSAARDADVIATASVFRRGASLCFARVEISGGDGSLVAHGQAVYKLEPVRTATATLEALFAGKSAADQMQLLAELEGAGAQLYEAWAHNAPTPSARAALLEAAERETRNAATLRRLTGTQS
ncbi:MAG: PaaI family thioesterase [Gammaproteobacteria bacterium]